MAWLGVGLQFEGISRFRKDKKDKTVSEIMKTIILVSPRGFCAGVDRAVQTVRECLDIFGPPVFVKHKIVHNDTIVRELEQLGAVTVESLDEIPQGSTVVFSAHGSPPEHYKQAKKKGLHVIDAACPLVVKVHLEARRYIQEGYNVFYIGHREHIECEGVRAEAKQFGKEIILVSSEEDIFALPSFSGKCAYLTQTTLSLFETEKIIQALRKRFPQIQSPPLRDICYATTNRQKAVLALAERADVVLVVGSKGSSNSNRLVETAMSSGKDALLVENLDAVLCIPEDYLRKKKIIGITSGASVPESLVSEIVNHFVHLGAEKKVLEVSSENISFSLPLELQKVKEARGI